jgi:CarD family transcriptional regulator
MASKNSKQKSSKVTKPVRKVSSKSASASKISKLKAKPKPAAKAKVQVKPVKKPIKKVDKKTAKSSKPLAKLSKLTSTKEKVNLNKAENVKANSVPMEIEKRKRGRPSLKDQSVLKDASSLELVSDSGEAVVKRGRGRPRKNPLPTAEELAAGPKKRGRKPKALANGMDQGNGLLQPGQLINPDIPIKRKRGRPRKSEQLGYGMSGPGRYGFLPRPNVQVKRYIWSAETGQSLSPDGISAESKDAALAASRAHEQVMEFREKDKVVYPAHGLGIVEAIQVRSVSGSQQKFYMVSIVETGMKIMVPVSQAKTVGLRRVVDPSTVDKVYAILKDKDVEIDNQTWNRRYREYSQKIKTGSVLEIASVIRDLTVLKIDKELSFNERRMLDTAQGLLVKELSIAKASPEDSIREELEEICQP